MRLPPEDRTPWGSPACSVRPQAQSIKPLLHPTPAASFLFRELWRELNPRLQSPQDCALPLSYKALEPAVRRAAGGSVALTTECHAPPGFPSRVLARTSRVGNSWVGGISIPLALPVRPRLLRPRTRRLPLASRLSDAGLAWSPAPPVSLPRPWFPLARPVSRGSSHAPPFQFSSCPSAEARSPGRRGSPGPTATRVAAGRCRAPPLYAGHPALSFPEGGPQAARRPPARAPIDLTCTGAGRSRDLRVIGPTS